MTCFEDGMPDGRPGLRLPGTKGGAGFGTRARGTAQGQGQGERPLVQAKSTRGEAVERLIVELLNLKLFENWLFKRIGLY